MKQLFTNLTLMQTNFFMGHVILSFTINNSKNFKGIDLYNFNLEFDNESLIITGGQNIEIIYPLNEITNIEFIARDNEYKLFTSNGEFLLSLIN